MGALHLLNFILLFTLAPHKTIQVGYIYGTTWTYAASIDIRALIAVTLIFAAIYHFIIGNAVYAIPPKRIKTEFASIRPLRLVENATVFTLITLVASGVSGEIILLNWITLSLVIICLCIFASQIDQKQDDELPVVGIILCTAVTMTSGLYTMITSGNVQALPIVAVSFWLIHIFVFAVIVLFERFQEYNCNDEADCEYIECFHISLTFVFVSIVCNTSHF